MSAPRPGDTERERLRATVRQDPNHFVAWLMLADAEMDHGDLAAADIAARRGAQLRPGHPEAVARLGRLRWMLGDHAQATALLGQASKAAPQHPGIALWLGHALEDAGQAEAAAQAYQRAHLALPDEPYIAAQLLNARRRLCDWSGVDALSRQVRQALARGNAVIEPFGFLAEDASAAEQLACARLRAAQVQAQVGAAPPRAPIVSRGPLRVGFLSNGFGAHPTGLLTVAFLEQLARHVDIELHLFSSRPDDGSPIRARLQGAAQALHDVAGLAHAQTAARIRQARIDVLFDLRGWGGGGTPQVLALRPAPVQVNWLAYPGTSGAPWLDYVLADRFVLPPALAPHFSEQVLYLPRAFQPSDDTRVVQAPPSRAACGLPERGDGTQGLVLCCFNNSYKLNAPSFGRMLEILRQVPGSVLWLLAGPGQADARLREAARQHVVDPRRLVFMDKLPHAQYLARYRHADLFLDTHPYNAHTTASDALWAGCPVLTSPGATFAARVAGTLNHHLRMPGMNVADDAAFVRRAVELAGDPAALPALRATLDRQRTQSGLFDMRRFAADFAALVRATAARHGWRAQ